jgi:hypothetical protein
VTLARGPAGRRREEVPDMLGEAIGDLPPSAVGVALSPIPRGGRRNTVIMAVV